MAKFRGEIYHEDDLLDVLGSEEMFVESGETAKLVSYYKILEPGNYTIKGRVLYAGKETEEKEVSFSVPVPEVEELGEVKNGIPGFEAVFAIIALSFISIFLAFSRIKGGKGGVRENE